MGKTTTGKTSTAKTAGPLAAGLRVALMNEVDGREFYRMAARDATNAEVRALFEFLMDEEARHYETLLDLAGRLASGKPPAFRRSVSDRKKLAAFRGSVVTPGMIADARAAEGEIAALSIGMGLEQRTIKQFSALRRKSEGAGDEAAASVFAELVAWEQDHLDLLSKRYEAIRESYWEEAHFWPF
jgi:rubrerythrin